MSAPTALQTLLSARPPRTTTAGQTPFVFGGGGVSATFAYEDGDEVMYSHLRIDHDAVKGGRNAVTTPPMHIHLGQTEFFTVLSGKMGAIVGGQHRFVTPQDGEVGLPVGVAHTFWAEQGAGDLKLRIRCAPQSNERGFDERFFRNFQSYLSDCEKHGMAPSPFQLILLLWSADIILGVPYLPIGVSTALHNFAANVVAKRILGYQESYPEYYEDKKST